MTESPTASLTARFAQDIASGDPDRIAAALAELRTIVPPRPPIALPEPDVLDAFPDGPPGEVVRDYIWDIGNYRPVEPPISPEETVRRWVEAVVRGADSAAALQVVLYLRHDPMPPGRDVGDALAYIARRGVRSPREREGAAQLARYFLDHSQTYARAVPALSAWREVPALADLLPRLTPYVRAEDRDGLGL